MRIVRLLWPLLAIILLAHCGEKTDTIAIFASEDAGQPPTDTAPAPEDTADSTPLDTADPPDSATETHPPCTSAADCESGWCVEGAEGQTVCTETCESECPSEWSCQSLTDDQGAEAEVCLYIWAGLCRPCVLPSDCPTTGSWQCRLQAPELGSFCAASCANGNICPAGYGCSEDGWCTPSDEICACTAASEGATTHCQRANEFGTCDGLRTCENLVLSPCNAGTASPEICDNLDNNCNGSTDETGIEAGDGPLQQACTVLPNRAGDCPGTQSCVDGAWEACQGVAASAEICDGLDNDCNGETDEGFADLDEDGSPDCVDSDDDDDQIADSEDNCPALANPEQDDLDQDQTGDACDPDIDGDGSLNDDDCAPEDAAIYPEADELCNNSDDNCNQDIDEDLSEACDSSNDAGSCGGIQTCFEGNWSCDAPTPEAEICDNLDNDCNGSTDDLASAACDNTNELGTCAGLQTCVEGSWVCDAAEPQSEICDGLDNDCNGNTDEKLSGDCDQENVHGVCAGTQNCVDGDWVCNAAIPAAESCDGEDNNCNGATDEGLSEACSESNTFGTCDGTQNCIEGDWSCNAPTPAAESCDDVDNDCDGSTDEELVEPCTQTNEFGSCTGSQTCGQGEWLCDAPTAEAEACDGLDNDCDGKTDEGSADTDTDGIADCVDPDDDNDGIVDEDDNCPLQHNPPPAPGFPQGDLDGDDLGDVCDPDIDGDGVCNGDLPITGLCTAGPDCKPANSSIYPGAVEQCDGEDTNCDDQIDNIPATPCDLINAAGTCEGTLACVSGSATCVGTEATVEICNGADEDCDGKADNGFPDTDLDGKANCVDEDDDNDGEDDGTDCAPLNDAISHLATEICNDVDDNCNGTNNEENAEGCATWYLDVDTDGYGVAAFSACLCGPKDLYLADKAGDCEPLVGTVHPAAAEACNGIDDNCDNETDEGFSDLDNDGQADCVDNDQDGDGQVDAADNCPAVANPNQENFDEDAQGDACDPDDDNDGALDDEDCKPFDPTIHPNAVEECDNEDNDCDDTVDQFDVPCSSSCEDGVATCIAGALGACSALEPIICTDYSSCSEGPTCVHTCPAPPAEICNGADDNCNNQVDEVFECSPTNTDSETCGSCGIQTRVCSDQCTWGNFGTCEPQGECSPGDTSSGGPCGGQCGTEKLSCNDSCQWEVTGCVDEGECSPTVTDTETCGSCGSKTRVCSSTCEWSAFSSCLEAGECTAGDVDTVSCGTCATRSRTCTDQCKWGSFGACTSFGECSPNDIQEQACGLCGKQVRTCSSTCEWSAFSSCVGQGECSPTDTQTTECGNCGEATRICDSTCNWSPFGACSGQGECAPGDKDTSACFGGCQSRTCSQTCNWPNACTNCSGCQTFQKCGVGNCGSDFHSLAFSKSASCGSTFSDNRTTCAPNCGANFKKCGVGNCATGYHAVSFHTSASCGSTFSSNQTTCVLTSGSVFKKCGIGNCPDGYVAVAFSKSASCGSTFSDNQTTCQQF